MIPIVAQNLPQIRSLCERFGIQKMFVFGSALHEENFKLGSDVDFLYKLKPEVAQLSVEARPDFFEMLFSFEALLGRMVDLIDLTRVTNPYFIQSVNQNKLKIYEA